MPKWTLETAVTGVEAETYSSDGMEHDIQDCRFRWVTRKKALTHCLAPVTDGPGRSQSCLTTLKTGHRNRCQPRIKLLDQASENAPRQPTIKTATRPVEKVSWISVWLLAMELLISTSLRYRTTCSNGKRHTASVLSIRGANGNIWCRERWQHWKVTLARCCSQKCTWCSAKQN